LTISGNRITRADAISALAEYPYIYGHALGFTLLTELHNDWIKQMVFGSDDETLQAHRGSYKTTCVSIALACICILYPNDKTMFMRKSDDDVKEIIEQTKKILENPLTKILVRSIYGVELRLIKASATEITTNLTNDPRGTAQLVGKGSKGSLTGKHFDRIFTDDIVNVQDRTSRAERDRTKVIYQELQNIKNRGITTVLVAHRLSTVRDCDRIIVLDQGKVAGQGKHADLMKNCQVYQEIALSQLSREELGYE
jgi:hypothetical protein